MKKLLFPLLLLPALLFAQHPPFPSYKSVVIEFFTHYNYTPFDPVDGLAFAKMKDGWHVQVIDQMKEKPKIDQLFWSAPEGAFMPLGEMEPALTGTEQTTAINSFLERNEFRFYSYDRCRYYGYGRWTEDMIRDFGNGDKANYSDNLLEGLARAYSGYASKFLWYQYGGEQDETDPLKQKLATLQKPSKQRIDSANHYLGKSIETYKMLAARNVQYKLTVGNPAMKVFNEQMNGFMQMAMAGFDAAAKQYLLSIQPNATLETIARNYLDNCPPNAILFTAGDNDTYPLWYLQQAKNYRTDVAVINKNLLGLPIYVDMLRRNKLVKFTTAPAVYGDTAFVYFLKTGEKKQTTSAEEFIKQIQNKTFPEHTDFYGDIATYTQSEIEFDLNLDKFKMISAQPNLQPHVQLKLGEYYLLGSDFMALDIVHSNVYNRPVCFSYDEEFYSGYLQMNGLVYQFLPLDKSKQNITERISFANVKNYLRNVYKPTPSTDLSSGLAPDYNMDGITYSLYVYAAQAFLKEGRADSAVAMIEKVFKAYENSLPFTTNQNKVAEILLNAGRVEEGEKMLRNYINKMYKLYREPISGEPYISRSILLQNAVAVKEMLAAKELDSSYIDPIISAAQKELY